MTNTEKLKVIIWKAVQGDFISLGIVDRAVMSLRVKGWTHDKIAAQFQEVAGLNLPDFDNLMMELDNLER